MAVPHLTHCGPNGCNPVALGIGGCVKQAMSTKHSLSSLNECELSAPLSQHTEALSTVRRFMLCPQTACVELRSENTPLASIHPVASQSHCRPSPRQDKCIARQALHVGGSHRVPA